MVPHHSSTTPDEPGGGAHLGRGLIVLALFVVCGALAGVLWEWLWTAPTGIALDGLFVLDEEGVSRDFGSTGSYVLLAVAFGLVLGTVSAFLLDRSELVALAVVLVGSVLAGGIMAIVGQALGPADPEALARTAEDLTPLVSDLRLEGRSPYLAFPLAALTGLMVVFLGLNRRRETVETENSR